MSAKKQYETPALAVVGTFETLTQSSFSGVIQDSSLSVTPPHTTNDFS